MITLSVIRDADILISVEPNELIDIEVESVVEGGGGRFPYYTGSYEITPKPIGQILPTENKSMSEDLVIKDIPYSVVTNPSGGETINIAYIL